MSVTKNNVVAFQPYVVVVDIVVEVPLVKMGVTLCFGPFESLIEADEWRAGFEQEHGVIEIWEAVESEQAFVQGGIPEKPFLRAYVEGADIVQVGVKMRAKGELIPPNIPVVDAHQVHIYALRACQEAVTAAFGFLDGTRGPA